MANTADILGEQETLDGLVAHTLEDFEDDRIVKVRQNALRYNNILISVNLPNAKDIGSSAFQYCLNLETVIMPMVEYLQSHVFSNCYKLKTLNIPNIKGSTNMYMFQRCYSLNDLDLTNITSLSSSALNNTGLGTLVLPYVISIGANAVGGVRTSTIDLSKKITITANVFNGAYSLVHLILRSDTLCSLSATSAFTNTPIANGLGWIYVPSGLVESYKTASNWSTYANQIVSLDEYPRALSGETITDSWDEIFQAESDGSYKTKYSVGDTKYLVVGGTYILMQIIAFDRDILSSDHTSTAKITWLQKNLSFQFPMIFTTTADWENCECRKFLSDTIYEQIPENVRNKILAVDKTYYAGTASGTATCSDKLWIPSLREVSSRLPYERSGVDYTDFFVDNSSRIKSLGLLTGLNSTWRLRSSDKNGSSTMFYNIGTGGTDGSASGGDSSVYFPLGFCT